MFASIDRSKKLSQLIPLILTLVILAILSSALYLLIRILNLLPIADKVLLVFRPVDIIVGATIYLKTAIDFAIFMGRLMGVYPGWRNRVALEIGTALGNAIGTMLVIILWVVFKEIALLLALMVFLASLVLFQLAQGGMEHLTNWETSSDIRKILYKILDKILAIALFIAGPLLRRIMPDLGAKLKGVEGLSWKGLFNFSFSIPFILGLDDFAGYVPLFSIVNVFSFSLGVIAAHTLLNIALFISPETTIKTVKNEYISFLGTIAFIFLAFYGLFEVIKILLHLI